MCAYFTRLHPCCLWRDMNDRHQSTRGTGLLAVCRAVQWSLRTSRQALNARVPAWLVLRAASPAHPGAVPCWCVCPSFLHAMHEDPGWSQYRGCSSAVKNECLVHACSPRSGLHRLAPIHPCVSSARKGLCPHPVCTARLNGRQGLCWPTKCICSSTKEGRTGQCCALQHVCPEALIAVAGCVVHRHFTLTSLVVCATYRHALHAAGPVPDEAPQS